MMQYKVRVQYILTNICAESGIGGKEKIQIQYNIYCESQSEVKERLSISHNVIISERKRKFQY